MGVVYAPVINELYFSSKDFGSFKVTVENLEPRIDNLINSAIKLPITRHDNIYTVVASRSHLSIETAEYIEIIKKEKGNIKLISKGSSLKLCLVAEGKADCYPRFAPTMEWDTAAGQAICEFSGFNVFDLETNKPMIYNRKKLLNNWFIVR